jgi:hypothetical protein
VLKKSFFLFNKIKLDILNNKIYFSTVKIHNISLWVVYEKISSWIKFPGVYSTSSQWNSTERSAINVTGEISTKGSIVLQDKL